MGFAFLFETAYLLPLTAVLLSLAVAALAFRARRRHGFAPFVLGSVAAAIVLVSRFGSPATSGVPVGLSIGIAMLIAASIWNSWPTRAFGGAVAPDASPESVGEQQE